MIGRYLRDNIRYRLDGEAEEGLRAFYSYATELGLASYDGELRIYHADYGAD
jgi:predicted solute-binding protein